jgi:hypothetical protein
MHSCSFQRMRGHALHWLSVSVVWAVTLTTASREGRILFSGKLHAIHIGGSAQLYSTTTSMCITAYMLQQARDTCA